MTSERRNGNDHPALAWIRANPRLDSIHEGLSVQDVDVTIHQFRVRIDRISTREVNNHMLVEIKTFGAQPTFAQADTHFITHQLLHTGRRYRRVKDAAGRWRRARSWGYHRLTFSGSCPQDSTEIWWDRSPISPSQLEEILTFRRDPDTLHPRDERRHHAPPVAERLIP